MEYIETVHGPVHKDKIPIVTEESTSRKIAKLALFGVITAAIIIILYYMIITIYPQHAKVISTNEYGDVVASAMSISNKYKDFDINHVVLKDNEGVSIKLKPFGKSKFNTMVSYSFNMDPMAVKEINIIGDKKDLETLDINLFNGKDRVWEYRGPYEASISI